MPRKLDEHVHLCARRGHPECFEAECACVQAKALLNAVNALPQLEQADKLIARMPPAKWAAEMQAAASKLL